MARLARIADMDRPTERLENGESAEPAERAETAPRAAERLAAPLRSAGTTARAGAARSERAARYRVCVRGVVAAAAVVLAAIAAAAALNGGTSSAGRLDQRGDWFVEPASHEPSVAPALHRWIEPGAVSGLGVLGPSPRDLLPAVTRERVAHGPGKGRAAPGPEATWSIAEFPAIERAFRETFGRALPVSAFGQTALHARAGLDHRAAVDVALHPGSLEGRWLILYLERRGIPFVAFPGAAPGWATGAHIHLGPPSPSLVGPRLARER